MASSLKKVLIFSITVFLLFLTVLLTSCTTPDFGRNTDDNETVTVFEMQNYVDISITVDKRHSSGFVVPVIVDRDLNTYNTNTAATNTKLYLISVEGENISDLTVEGRYDKCTTSVSIKKDEAYPYYVCLFNLTVSASNNWQSSNQIRKITKAKFKVLDKEIEVPLNIVVSEEGEVSWIDECSILRNITYSTISRADDSEFKLSLNWDISGWGAENWEDPNYATIVGFYFQNSKLELTELKVVQLVGTSTGLEEEEMTVDLADPNYKIETNKAAMGDAYIEFSAQVGNASELAQFVGDNLIMVYTLNGGVAQYKVNLANVQLYDCDALLVHYNEVHAD